MYVFMFFSVLVKKNKVEIDTYAKTTVTGE